ncbi:MAG: hypothetical protein V1887_01590 [Candidatus Aenigmatarchaeota archaeon]
MRYAPLIAAAATFIVLSSTIALAVGEVTDKPLAIREDAGRLYVSYDQGRIRVFDSSTLELLNEFTAEGKFIPAIETDDDNIYYGTGVGGTNTSFIMAITKGGETVSSAEGRDIFLSVLIHDGRLYDCQRNGIVEIRSVPDLKVLFSANNSGFCGSVRVDDKYVYSTAEKKIIIRDKKDLSKVAEISADSDRIRALWVDNEKLYSIADDSALKIWNKTDFSQIGNQSLNNPWALTGYGDMIFSTSDRGLVALDRSGNIIATMNSNGIEVYGLYATDKALYGTHQDGTVRIWDTKTFNNTVASQIFQYTPAKYQNLELIQAVSYVLLAVGVIGFVALTIRDRRRKKKAISATATPPAEPIPVKPAEQS